METKKFMVRWTDIFQMGMYIKIVYGGMYGQMPDSLPVGQARPKVDLIMKSIY